MTLIRQSGEGTDSSRRAGQRMARSAVAAARHVLTLVSWLASALRSNKCAALSDICEVDAQVFSSHRQAGM